jgi:excisionase family DNA binding protein
VTSRRGDQLLTAEEVAELVGMTVEWVWDQSRKGSIPTITLGRSRRYRRLAILRWLEEIESGGRPSV